MEIKMFGKNLRIEREDGWGITLKAPTKKETAKLATLFNEPVIGYTTHMNFAVTPEDEEEWWEKTRKDKGTVAWGIYADKWTKGDVSLKGGLVGFTSLHMNEGSGRVLSSGIIIANKSFWGKGVAGLAHIGRTWYATKIFDAELILSHVLAGSEEVNYKGSYSRWKGSRSVTEGNWPSRKALERVGYTMVHTEPASMKSLDKRHAIWRFQWINPQKIQSVFPQGLPKKYERGVELAEETLSKASTMIKNI